MILQTQSYSQATKDITSELHAVQRPWSGSKTFYLIKYLFEQFKLSANFSNLCAEIYKAMYVLKGKFEIFHVSKKLNNFKALKMNSLTPYNSITLLFFGFI